VQFNNFVTTGSELQRGFGFPQILLFPHF
jgi:hypothetical protein